MGTMSIVLQQSLADLRNITSQLHTYGFETLEITRALDGENSPYFHRLTTVAEGIIAIISKSSNAESVIQQSMESMMKDLDTVGLTSLAPEWETASDAKGKGQHTRA